MVLIPNNLDNPAPLSFGKHKGLTLDDVLEIDPSYIVWLHDNVGGVVSHDLYETAIDELFEQQKNHNMENLKRSTKHKSRFLKRWS